MGLLSWFTGRQDKDTGFGLAERERLRRYIADIEAELCCTESGIPMAALRKSSLPDIGGHEKELART